MIRTDNIGPIQKGIPIPAKPGGRASDVRIAVEELEVGESRVFSGVTSRKLVQVAASIRKATGRAYAVRAIGDVVRVWRTA